MSNDEMNIFERAARQNLHFPAPRGSLTPGQLWALPLNHSDPFVASLESVAQLIHAAQKELGETRFTTARPTEQERTLELAMAVVKHVIAAKQAEARAARDAARRREQREALLDALDNKDRADREAMSREEILAQLEALDAGEAESAE